jgi:hypothetical protein
METNGLEIEDDVVTGRETTKLSLPYIVFSLSSISFLQVLSRRRKEHEIGRID